MWGWMVRLPCGLMIWRPLRWSCWARDGSDEKGNVAACLGELRSEVSADGSCADYENFHVGDLD